MPRSEYETVPGKSHDHNDPFCRNRIASNCMYAGGCLSRIGQANISYIFYHLSSEAEEQVFLRYPHHWSLSFALLLARSVRSSHVRVAGLIVITDEERKKPP